METELDVIMRRLADVPPVKGTVRLFEIGASSGPGVSRYQRRSAHLRDRDCSLALFDADALDVDLTED